MWKKRTKSKTSKSARSKLIAKLDKVFSKIIRLRDSSEICNRRVFKCISCGRTLPYEQADCGHYVNRQHMALRYSEVNCNAQCRHCNRFMEGNIQGYRRGLIEKYGERTVEILESKQYETNKITNFELEQMIKFYQAKLKEYEL